MVRLFNSAHITKKVRVAIPNCSQYGSHRWSILTRRKDRDHGYSGLDPAHGEISTCAIRLVRHGPR
jgi:hypothetical protein